MSVTETAPTAIHRGEDELPFVDLGDGTTLQLLQVDLANGVWVIRNHFAPGTTLPIHKHTGQVYAFTQRGSWHYLESPEALNTAGSYLYEPAGSVHTLQSIDDNTRVWFHMYGVNLNLAEDGSIESVADGAGALQAYYALCEAQGFDRPKVIVA